MELQYFGANCIRLNTKKATIVIDDNLAQLGAKSVSKAGDIGIHTFAQPAPVAEPKLLLDRPGEYEVSDISIKGIAARGHMDEKGVESATIFQIMTDDLVVGVVGHVYPELSNDQLEALGMIDILIIPCGGNGYTLDPVGALKLIKTIEPKLVIPTHYDVTGVSYEVPQQPLDAVLKGLAMEPKETVSKLKVKEADLDENTQLVVLEKS